MRNLEVHRPSGKGTSRGSLVFTIPPRFLVDRIVPSQAEESEKWRQRTRVLKEYAVVPDDKPVQPELVKGFSTITAREFRTTKVAAVDRGLLGGDALKNASVDFTPRVLRNPSGVRLVDRLRVPGWATKFIVAGDAAAESPPPDPAPAEVPSSDVTVLAFICKRLPRTPDPLPDMQW